MGGPSKRAYRPCDRCGRSRQVNEGKKRKSLNLCESCMVADPEYITLVKQNEARLAARQIA